MRALKLRGPSFARGNCFGGIAYAHAAAGRLEDAVLWRRKALAENPAGTWMHIMDSCYALKTGNRSRVVEAAECMRRAQPVSRSNGDHITVHKACDPAPAGPLLPAEC